MARKPRKGKPKRTKKQIEEDLKFAKDFTNTVLRKIATSPKKDPLEVLGTMLRDISKETSTVTYSQICMVLMQGIWFGACMEFEPPFRLGESK